MEAGSVVTHKTKGVVREDTHKKTGGLVLVIKHKNRRLVRVVTHKTVCVCVWGGGWYV